MKTSPRLASLFVSLVALPLFAAEPQNLVVNGDFQTGQGPAFYATTSWYNRGAGLNQGTAARTDKGVPGEFWATINDRYDAAGGKFGPIAHTQRTAHVIQAGQAFAVTYQWHPVDDYWQKRRDTVRVVLYATADDKVGGAVVWSSVLTSDFFLGPITTPKTVVQQSEPVSPAAVGKRLMVTFHGIDTEDGVTGPTHYARLDNLVVIAIGQTAKP